MPYDYTAARYGYLAPTQQDVFSPVTYRWKAPFVCYVNVAASTNVVIESPYGTGRAQLFVYRGNTELAGGQLMESRKSSQALEYLTASVTLNRLLLQPGEEIEIRLKLSRGPNFVGLESKWGFTAFTGAVYVSAGNTLPLDSFSVEILPELPPGGALRLQELLPDWSQKDFVKALVGL
ncbi:hypothetical protein [Hymenobacter lucidus]|uniref:Uncharacterized protein n=1 Tax=Hymenobacter lucidus TaxID=2880930 RepID=A0ABS8ASQ1_9BACT|nr:hypothetical protein [Hymenobacter lucidus]MCB2408062.1 hypothetical protein [Hymenobacter lucidus]